MTATGAARSFIRTIKEVREKKSLLQKIREYRSFVDIRHETGDFLVTTASNGSQLLKVLELRHEVFVEEWQGRRTYHGLDVDSYDFGADHLIIFDKRISEIVGTYRLISSHFTRDFYSSSEFHLGDFLRLAAVKLEMGRACVHANYRDGNTIDLLWKGLSQYIAKTKTEFLFGCSSIRTTQPLAVSRLFRTLKDQGSWSDDYRIRPTADYEFPGFSIEGQQPLDAAEKRELLPPLLRSYLHAGAVAYGTPALDTDFNCTDVLTVLDWSKLNRRFQSRFT